MGSDDGGETLYTRWTAAQQRLEQLQLATASGDPREAPAVVLKVLCSYIARNLEIGRMIPQDELVETLEQTVEVWATTQRGNDERR